MKNTVFKIMQKVNFWIARTIDIAKYAVKSDNIKGEILTQGIYGSLYNMSIEYIPL